MCAEKESGLKRSSNGEMNWVVIGEKVTARGVYEEGETRDETVKKLCEK